MRSLVVLLLVSVAASTASAQQFMPSNTTGMPTGGEAGLTADGKIMLGLDGRGNYRKPKADKKANNAMVGAQTKMTDNSYQALRRKRAPNLTGMPDTLKPSPATAPSAARPEVKPQPTQLRSDKAMISDNRLAIKPPAVLPNSALPTLPAKSALTNETPSTEPVRQ